MIEITSYARRYRTMRDEGPRECFPGSECSGHRCLNPALNCAGFEGGYEPAGSHRRFAEQEHADLFVKEVGGELINRPKKAMARDFEEAEADGPQVSVGTMLRCFVHCCCSRSACE